MYYVVVDLEWNQSSTGKDPECEKIPFEIIEIGAVKVNEAGKIIDEFSSLIKPVVYRKMHTYTSKIINLQMADLQSGRTFDEVCTDFINWCGEDYKFVTWGPQDLTELQINMDYHNLAPLSHGPLEFVDLQKVFAKAYESDKKNRSSLEKAVDALEIEKDIPFHRAFSDAYYTGVILGRIMDEKPEFLKFVSYNTYRPPITKQEEVFADFGTYQKYISRVFADKKSLSKDRKLRETVCAECGKTVPKKINWFSVNQSQILCLAACPVHGYIKSRVRVYKYDEGGVYAVKITKPVSENKAAEVKAKKEHIQAEARKRNKKHRDKLKSAKA